MSKRAESTLTALLRDKPRRGRPRRSVSRQSVYVALTKPQKEAMAQLAARLPAGISRADVPDLAITILAARLEGLRRSVSDRDREMPEGITDLDSLYLLWDSPLPNRGAKEKWTTIRLSPQPAIELGRAQGVLHALFGASRSDVFALALALLTNFITEGLLKRWSGGSLLDLQEWLTRIYL